MAETYPLRNVEPAPELPPYYPARAGGTRSTCTSTAYYPLPSNQHGGYQGMPSAVASNENATEDDKTPIIPPRYLDVS